jgi:hypothetical protein
MKIVSRKSSFFALGILAIAATLCLYACSRQVGRANYQFTLKIHGPNNDKYLQLKIPQTDFDTLLDKVKQNRKGGDYDIGFVCKDGENEAHPYNPHDPHFHPVCRTDRVTKSDAADRSADGASAANDPNVTYHLSSNDPDDIKSVLAAFQ